MSTWSTKPLRRGISITAREDLPPYRLIPNRSGFAPGIDPLRLNQLGEDLQAGEPPTQGPGVIVRDVDPLIHGIHGHSDFGFDVATICNLAHKAVFLCRPMTSDRPRSEFPLERIARGGFPCEPIAEPWPRGRGRMRSLR